ncbi:MAG: glycosyltransferase family 39 protein [bacterium]|nr:glycosyltransferase family 39 protein [bacterium]
MTRHWPTIVAVLLTGGATVFMGYAAWTDTAVMDELPHIPAGYSYVRFLDYRLNPEHPPLLKAAAALPLLAVQPKFPTESKNWTTEVNGQWEIGREFFYRVGNNGAILVQLARIVPILLTLVLIMLIFRWGTELLGARWALIPTALAALSPTLLAHGHYVTTDLGAAFGVFLATMTFVRYLMNPTGGRLLAAGISFGVAQLLKFSLFLLVPYFGLLGIIWWLGTTIRNQPSDHRMCAAIRGLWLTVRRYLAVLGIGYLLVYAIYAIFTLGYPAAKQLADTESILRSFESSQWVAPYLTPLIGNPITRPFAQYLLGLSMVFVRAAGGNTGYLFGTVTNAGWWFYFPLMFLMKETLASLLILGGGAVVAITAFLKALRGRRPVRRFAEWLGTHFPEFAMGGFVALYWTASISSPLNIGVRHLLPAIPFMYLLAAAAWKWWVNRPPTPTMDLTAPASPVPPLLMRLRADRSARWTAVLVALLVWLGAETAFASPYFLSYFNELSGGTRSGYRYVVDSNYDWGQDLGRLREWLATYNREHPNEPVKQIAMDYFGGGDPGTALAPLGVTVVNWWPAKGDPRGENIEWLAVSVNSLQGGLGEPVRGWQRPSQDSYAWLKDLKPVPSGVGQVPTPTARAGTSIFIYHL